MADGGGDGPRSKAAQELVLRTIAAHADSLLRTARRHSLCFDDAQDAYQRGLEIFIRHADRLDPGRAASWLHTVIKHEALAVRRSRQRLVGSEEADLDAVEERRLPTPDERLLTFDMVTRSAEALQRLKPQELRALWLKAQGHSYNDIGEITGWSYTKVNRCLTEGRRRFLTRYAGIESGAECRRWAPVISAMVDGEATPEQILELRPHLRNCPGCRATFKALQDSSAPLSAVLPVPLVAVAADRGDLVGNLVLRAYEAVAGGLHERAITGVTKAQAALEASAAGKVAAVAASAAAVAGGGYATVEQAARPDERDPAAQVVTQAPAPEPPPAAAPPATPPPGAAPATATPTVEPPAAQTEFGTAERPDEFTAPEPAPASGAGAAPEFSSAAVPLGAVSAQTSSSSQAPASASRPRSRPSSSSPEFGSPAVGASGGSQEFGP
jgi:RNA polymerase sigma factor (sigma-70 family)